MDVTFRIITNYLLNLPLIFSFDKSIIELLPGYEHDIIKLRVRVTIACYVDATSTGVATNILSHIALQAPL